MIPSSENLILNLTDGIRFAVGNSLWAIPSLKIPLGKWVALIPQGPMSLPNPAGPLSWILATMQEPDMGTVDLLDEDIYRLEYTVRQRLRSKIGYVHGYGGLLSNRSVAENLALPLNVHGGLSRKEEANYLHEHIKLFSLENVADLKPHEMDGATRWRVCLARALILNPSWLVLEGLGNWEMDHGAGVGWTELVRRRREGALSAVICMVCEHPGFENWFESNGGTILRYTKVKEST